MTKCSILILAFTCLVGFTSQAQEEKKSIKLSIGYLRINEETPELTVTAKSKRGKKFEPVSAVEVEFFQSEQKPENSLGKSKTNRKGVASIEMPAAVVAKLDSMSPFKLIAFVPESKEFSEQSTEIEITKARIELSLTEADSARKVNATLLALKNGKWVAAPEAEMKLFVKRIFSDLPLTEHALTTGETGEASADFNFKTAIPGDANGNIIIGAKVEDNESFGTIVSLKYAKWGVVTEKDRSFFERSLWAARDKTPIWLLVFPNIAIVTVWGLIFYMFYLIFRIRKIGLQK